MEIWKRGSPSNLCPLGVLQETASQGDCAPMSMGQHLRKRESTAWLNRGKALLESIYPLWGRKNPEVPTVLSVECQLATEGENKQERKGFWASCGADIKWELSPHAVTCRRTTQQEGLLGPDQVVVFIRRCPQSSGKLAEELLSRPW